MDFSRRKLLTYSAAGLAGVVAGCSEDTGDSVATEADDDPEDSDNTPTQSGDTSTPEATETPSSEPGPDNVTVDLGEAVIYTSGENELAFTATGATLRDAILWTASNNLYTQMPSNASQSYLVVDVETENRGNGRVSTPEDPVLTLNGRQYERSYVVQGISSYQAYNELLAGSRTAGQVVFEIPPADASGQLVVNFSAFDEPTTGRWNIDVGDLEPITYDYTGNGVDELITFGTNGMQYRIGATDIRETTAYTYTSGGYEFTQEAPAGQKYALVAVFAENTGDQPVTIPGTYNMSLRAGSSQVDAGFYSGPQSYDGGTIAPGVERHGIMQFEVPASASNYELHVDLTREITASWNL